MSQGDPDTAPIVTNTGTDTAAVLNFTIPKGEKGEKGDAGPRGPEGKGLPYPMTPAMLSMIIEGGVEADWGTVTSYSIDSEGHITYGKDSVKFRQSAAANMTLMAYFVPFPVNRFYVVKTEIANNNSNDIVLTAARPSIGEELNLPNTLNSGCQIAAYYNTSYSYYPTSGSSSTANMTLKDNVEYSCPCNIQLLKATSTQPLNTIIPATIVIQKSFEGSGKTGLIMTLVPSVSLKWESNAYNQWDRLIKILL